LENGENKNGLTLTPKHSIKGDLLFVVDNNGVLVGIMIINQGSS